MLTLGPKAALDVTERVTYRTKNVFQTGLVFKNKLTNNPKQMNIIILD